MEILANRKRYWIAASFLIVNTMLPAQLCNAGTDLTRIRALHMGGNWGGNQGGIRTAGSPLLNFALPISATSISTVVNRSSFTNSSGTIVTDDIAQVRLAGVMLGGTALDQAGFWVGRDTSTQNLILQFRPSLDPSLAGITGFAADITLSMPADGSRADLSQASRVTGTALSYVASIVAAGWVLMQRGTYSINGAATLDRNSVVQALQKFQAAVQAQQDEYFTFLKNENVNWLGISVAIFNDSISDATVKVHYRPAGDTGFAIYTFDDADLQTFITRAKQFGLHIYLTLAFEPSSLDMPPSLTNPACKTPGYKVSRWYLGSPIVTAGDPNQACINPAYWWWNPAHPDYAKNVPLFWNSYTDVAVKYAGLCQKWGVEIFSLGTETDHLFRTRPSTTWTNHFATQLKQMVSAVRAVYSGLVTYDQHFSTLTSPEQFAGAEGSKFLFQDLALDVAGVSAYFHLASAPVNRVLPVSELETAWDNVFRSYLTPLLSRNPGIPVVFTEFGYTDDLGSPAQANSNTNTPEPPRDANGVTSGMQQQQNILQAFFNVDDRYNDLVRGAFIWGNEVFTNDVAPACNAIGFNLYCKPSAPTIANVYAGWLARDSHPPVTAVVNGASFKPDSLAPGGFFTVFTSGLSVPTTAATDLPLPQSLGGVSIQVNGVSAPLLYVSATQINTQLPFEISPGTATLTLTAVGSPSANLNINVLPAAPGIFLYSGTRGVVQDQDYSLNGSTNPEKVGNVIIAYFTGQGSVDNPLPTGSAAPLDKQSRTKALTTATIGGLPAQVLFSGLVGGFVGLAQANIVVPNLPPGDYPLIISVGGVASNAASISVSAP